MERSLQPKNLVILGVVIGLVTMSPASGQQPNRLRTLLYKPAEKQWVENNPPLPGTAEGDLFEAKRLARVGEYDKALSRVAAFLKTYGDSHELYPPSVLVKAQALVGQKKYDDADKVVQAFLSQFSGIELTGEALRIYFVVAENFLGGAKRRLWWIFWGSGEQRGLSILDEIVTDHPNSRLAELATKTKADHLFESGDHMLAELEYARLLRDYPQSRYHQVSLSRTAEAALASFGGVDYDEAALIEADERFREYQSAYRGAAERDGVDLILEAVREMRGEKDLRIGEYYERTEHVTSAIFYYRNVRHDFPNTLASAKATERLSLLGAPVEADGN